MKDPRHPAGPAFNKAADAREAWRQQQVTALTETQRQIYDQARQKSEKRQEAKDNELAQRRQTQIAERMRSKLRETPQLVLTPKGKPVTMTAMLAKRLVDEHFQVGGTPGQSAYAAAVARAKEHAEGEVDHAHQREREALARTERQGLDDRLRGFDRARQTQPERRQELARAASRGKPRTDFKNAAHEQALKSPAVARAVEKVKKQEVQERARADRERDQARGPSGHSR